MANLLCADDFGLTRGVTDAIIELSKNKVLGATSVMTEGLYTRNAAGRLSDTGISKGLHFNLTHGFGDNHPYRLPFLMFSRSLSPQVRRDVSDRLRRQLDDYESIFGQAPDFLDGHQHVHSFPAIRHIFLEELARRYQGAEKPWIRQVRTTSIAPGARVKAMVLAALNDGFSDACKSAGFPTNKTFAGIYNFSANAPYSAYLDRWMADADALITCHPANAVEAADPLSAARFNEYRALMAWHPKTRAA